MTLDKWRSLRGAGLEQAMPPPAGPAATHPGGAGQCRIPPRIKRINPAERMHPTSERMIRNGQFPTTAQPIMQKADITP